MKQENSIEKKGNENIVGIVFLGILFISIVGLVFISIVNEINHPLSVSKLEKVNKVLTYDTMVFKGTSLFKLQNQIYEDLKVEKENINYEISNVDLLVMDLNTKEFDSNELAIGKNLTIEIKFYQNKKIISYNNLSEKGRKVIVKQMKDKNYSKIKMKTIESKNSDNSYSINVVIEN